MSLNTFVHLCIGEHLFHKIMAHVSVCLTDEHWRRRLIIFTTTTKQCEKIAEHLECPCYYSKALNKSDTLHHWISGEMNLIIAIRALGTGIDSEGITPCQQAVRPHRILSGNWRASRGNSLTSTSNDAAMITFITTEGCWRTILSGYSYLDGMDLETTCFSAQGERCDKCMRPVEIELESMSRRANVMARDERVEQKAIGRMKEKLANLYNKCPCYWILGHSSEHKVHQCQKLVEMIGSDYQALRKVVKYDPNSCCFRCSVPGDWCPDYVNGRGLCAQQDSIFPICLTAFGHPPYQAPYSTGRQEAV